MFTVVATADQLRKALKEIEKAEANGFMYCLAVFHLKEYGSSILDCKIEFDDICEKAHPTNGSLNWGRGQKVTERNKFVDGKLIPINMKSIEIVNGNKTIEVFTGESLDYFNDWNALMRCAEKIAGFWDNNISSINGKVFDFKHMMFHQIISEREYLWKRCVEFCREYIEWSARREN